MTNTNSTVAPITAVNTSKSARSSQPPTEKVLGRIATMDAKLVQKWLSKTSKTLKSAELYHERIAKRHEALSARAKELAQAPAATKK